MNDVSLFPRDNLEALSFLYVQNQDLTGKSPSDILRMYYDAYNQIAKADREYRVKEAEKKPWF